MPPSVVDICRYPVKGLSAEHLERAVLTRGEGVPHDRRFAIARDTTDFDPERPAWRPKTDFLMLMRDAKLAELRTRFDDTSGVLTIEHGGEPALRAKITEPAGRAEVAAFFAAFMAARDAPKLVEAAGHMFSDARRKVVSVINLASVRELERMVGRPVDPLRFRANLYLDGAPAWAEFAWTGHVIAAGRARLRVAGPIDNPREASPWQEVHELSEQGLAGVHEHLLGKTPTSAPSNSNRYHGFTLRTPQISWLSKPEPFS